MPGYRYKAAVQQKTVVCPLKTQAYLGGHGIVLGANQSAKTKSSLEFFSASLESNRQK